MNSETRRPAGINNLNSSRAAAAVPPPFLSLGRVRALLIAIILAAAFLRFYDVGEPSLWDGEIFTLLFAQIEWGKLWQSVSAFSAHPPLWFALTKLVITGGWNEALLRMPAVFAGILTVPAVYALAKRFFDVRVAVLSAALVAISPLDVIFSQNARNYSLFVLLTVLLLYAAVRAVAPRPLSVRQASERLSLPFLQRIRFELGRAGWWVLFVCAALAGLYTHYLFVLPLMGTVLAVAVKLGRDAARQVQTSQPATRKRLPAWWGVTLVSARAFLTALIVIGALYLPWVPSVGSAFVGRQLTREGSSDEETAALTLDDAPRLLKDFSGITSWGMGLVGALAVAGVAASWRGKRWAPLFWFGIAILLPVAAMIVLAPRRLPSKYLIYLLPAYLQFAAAGIVSSSDFLAARVLKAPRLAYAFSFVLLALLAIATLPNMSYWNGRREVFTGKGWAVVDDWKPWRAVASSVTAGAAPGDFILFPSEARALTARSVVPYLPDDVLQKLYSAPPTGHVWWVSEAQDVPPENAAYLQEQTSFDGNVVLQQLQHSNEFYQVPLPNPGFENGLDGWEKPQDSALWVQDTKTAADGKASGRMTVRRAQYSSVRSQSFAVTPGKLYRVTAYVKSPTFGFYTSSPQLFVNFYDASNTPPKRTRLPIWLTSDKKGWLLTVAEGVVPSDAVSARIEFGFRDYARILGPVSWIDDVRVWLEK